MVCPHSEPSYRTIQGWRISIHYQLVPTTLHVPERDEHGSLSTLCPEVMCHCIHEGGSALPQTFPSSWKSSQFPELLLEYTGQVCGLILVIFNLFIYLCHH